MSVKIVIYAANSVVVTAAHKLDKLIYPYLYNRPVLVAELW